jgi:UDP-N-acetylglucosamine 1-carboxyvinyltransferase
MDTFTVTGKTVLRGTIGVAGAKNVALKALVASLLTDDKITLTNAPEIRDVRLMLDVLSSLGVESEQTDHTVYIRDGHTTECAVPLEVGARLRTSSMVMGPLLARHGQALIPNPGGCRIGARPIGRHIEGLRSMGATIEYSPRDGYFHAVAEKLHGATITFDKNTHTGTETILLAAVLAEGRTVIENAAEEPEVDDLIALLTAMGAKVGRFQPRTIVIDGVDKLHGATHRIMPDRNEEATWAVAAAVTDGSVTVTDSRRDLIGAFLEPFTAAGGGMEAVDATTTRYYRAGDLTAREVSTSIHPGFMTDWQAPWAVLMTQASGVSTLHETVFENRFSYVAELKKMGAKIDFYTPVVENPASFYNFDLKDGESVENQAIRIEGRTPLHNAVLTMNDLRAGATMLIAAMAAEGVSTISGIEQIDRGYEHIEDRLNSLGARIVRSKGE